MIKGQEKVGGQDRRYRRKKKKPGNRAIRLL